MTPDDLRKRTQAFAVRVVRVVEAMPHSTVGSVLGRQLLRAGTSVGANYRSACRARSRRDFTAKMGIVEEECDETRFWLELLVETRTMPAAKLTALMREASELLAIVAASRKISASRSAASAGGNSGKATSAERRQRKSTIDN